jgi:hypothetical protein
LPGVQLDAEPDQVFQGADVDVAGDEGGHGGVAGNGLGVLPVQPGAALGAGVGGERPARGPPGADLSGPFLLQRRVAVQQQVRLG